MNLSTISAGKANCRMYANQARYHLDQAIREINTCIVYANSIRGVDSHKTVAKLQSVKGDLQAKLNSLSVIPY